jgi:hypothetical protein
LDPLIKSQLLYQLSYERACPLDRRAAGTARRGPGAPPRKGTFVTPLTAESRTMSGGREAASDLPASQANMAAPVRGRVVAPMRRLSMARAASRPSAIAQTTRDCPRRMSPAAKTPGTLDM